MTAALEAWQSDANVDRVASLLDRHIPAPRQADLRRFEWYYLRRLVDQGRQATALRHDVAIFGMSFSADSRRLAVAAAQHGAYVWDLSGNSPTQIDHQDGMFLAVDYAEESDFLVGGGFGPLGAAQVWTPSDSNSARTKFQTKGEILGIATSPDSTSFAAVSADGRLAAWNLETDSWVFDRQVFPNSSGNQCWNLEYSADGTMLACGTYTNPICVFIDAQTGAELRPLQDISLREWCIAFDSKAERQLIASGSLDGEITLYRITQTGGEPVHQFRAHNGLIRDLAFSPDGRWLASCGNDGTVQLFDIQYRHRVATLRGHSNWVRKVEFAPNGTHLASLGSDSTIKLWRISDILEQPQRIVLPQGDYYDMEYFSENRVVIASSSDAVELVDLLSGEIKGRFEFPANDRSDQAPIIHVDVSQASGVLAASTFDGEIAAWIADDFTQLWRREGDGRPAFGLALSPDGKRVASTAFRVRFLSAATGELEKELDRLPLPTEGLAISSDGRWLAVGCFDSNVRVWSTESWKMVELKGHCGIGHGVAFAPGKHVLATGAEDGRVILWQIAEDGSTGNVTAYVLNEFDRQPTPAFTLRFSPDGRTLASGNGNALNLLDVETYQLRAIFREHDAQVQAITYSPDGTTLVSLDRSGVLIVRRAK